MTDAAHAYPPRPVPDHESLRTMSIVVYALMLASYLSLDAAFAPEISAYWQRLQAREGYRRALAAQQRAAAEQGVDPTPAPLA